ncbi:hypothetical protein [Streptomyces sp. NBC_00582]|uniref:hypothetical protein n=1 Tax=Streptomyces sp. NBC_00582 TaxID=2975783 RepID=UPI002E7FD171|nr:hypothetical protein [Streptomyces sp. NBC_00582]WUB65454.1 hypothetical protein OG852_36080 [Streptomyces sp. NBC_00582]
MGIRTHHRRTAVGRGTATADTQGAPGAPRPRRPLPALAPGASTAHVPGLPAAARVAHSAEQVRACLTLALAALSRLHRRKPVRRITVFVATTPLSARPDGSAPR